MAITFDDWIKNNPGYKNIGLIKIDVQGHEAQVINGMDKFLLESSDLYIICEFDNTVNDNIRELYNMIIAYGFNEFPTMINDDKVFYKS